MPPRFPPRMPSPSHPFKILREKKEMPALPSTIPSTETATWTHRVQQSSNCLDSLKILHPNDAPHRRTASLTSATSTRHTTRSSTHDCGPRTPSTSVSALIGDMASGKKVRLALKRLPCEIHSLSDTIHLTHRSLKILNEWGSRSTATWKRPTSAGLSPPPTWEQSQRCCDLLQLRGGRPSTKHTETAP